MAPADEQFLDLAAVCRRYSISDVTVWRWTKHGRLPPPVYFDNARRWPLSELVAFEAERDRAPAVYRPGPMAKPQAGPPS